MVLDADWSEEALDDLLGRAGNHAKLFEQECADTYTIDINEFGLARLMFTFGYQLAAREYDSSSGAGAVAESLKAWDQYYELEADGRFAGVGGQQLFAAKLGYISGFQVAAREDPLVLARRRERISHARKGISIVEE